MAKQRSADRTTADADAADAQTFRSAVRDVIPLAQTAPAAGLAKPKPRARLRTAAAVEENLDAAMPLVEAAVTGEEVLSFQRPGVRTQVMRRLRRGLYPIDEELDLHGLSQTAARDQLADFIARSRDAGCRCVRPRAQNSGEPLVAPAYGRDGFRFRAYD
jgi:DNA-nicking Smr family endonuclease